jgi:hypothetical protein
MHSAYTTQMHCSLWGLQLQECLFSFVVCIFTDERQVVNCDCQFLLSFVWMLFRCSYFYNNIFSWLSFIYYNYNFEHEFISVTLNKTWLHIYVHSLLHMKLLLQTKGIWYLCTKVLNQECCVIHLF